MSPPIEYCESFRSYGEWQLRRPSHKSWVADLNASIESLLRHGIDSDFFGHIPPQEIEVAGENLREKLFARKLNSRQRAVLELLAGEACIGGRAKIFAPEAITELALQLRGRFPFFVGSEYAATKQGADDLYPVPIEDLQRLTFRTASFDAVLSCDVLEHVPDLFACLREMARVLKPGGLMISSHPFTWREKGRIKALLKEGQVQYIEPPEYHGNPVSANGSLVFTVPGWDILDHCRNSGFRDAEMLIIASTKKGILGGPDPFINILRART